MDGLVQRTNTKSIINHQQQTKQIEPKQFLDMPQLLPVVNGKRPPGRPTLGRAAGGKGE